MNELALFAGVGGGLLASRILGWRTVCAVEIDSYCASILIRRQNEGFLDAFPIWDDICTFNASSWSGIVDVVSGGFPCQDISSAGKGVGLVGERSGLWFEMLRIIAECKPAFCFVENSPYLRTRGLVTVLQGLAGLGFTAEWGVLGAADVGAPHLRKRMWIFATHPDRCRERGFAFDAEMAGAPALRDLGGQLWQELPTPGMVNGLANRVERTRATGNGQVPLVAASAWELLTCR